MPIPGRTVFVGNKELFVREAGLPDAPPLVLIHGFGGWSRQWKYQLLEFSASNRVIAIDRDHPPFGHQNSPSVYSIQSARFGLENRTAPHRDSRRNITAP